MKKLTLVLFALLAMACQTTKLAVKQDTPARLAKLPRTERAQRLLSKYGVSNAEIASVIERMKDIPVDLTPVFPAAGER